MLLSLAYGKDEVNVQIEDTSVLGIIEGNDVISVNEDQTILEAIENPINSKTFRDFISGNESVLFVVNDATRPTPTARILEVIYPGMKSANVEFIVATGGHRAPTAEEYLQIFGSFYESYKSQIYVHNCRHNEDMVTIGKSRFGFDIKINKKIVEAKKLVLISSVEPHYFAGYTGGRKSIFPGTAAYSWIEQNHKLSFDRRACALSLEGNPVHEDMNWALQMLKDKPIFSIMTVLDKYHHIHKTFCGDVEDSFKIATDAAKQIFSVRIKQKADIVVSVARFPMDLDLYQAQKALDNGKLALEDDGILILVAECRNGIGSTELSDMFKSCSSPIEVVQKAESKFVLGYHKAAKLAEIGTWANTYIVSSLHDHLAEMFFFEPFPSAQSALDHALSVKGMDAKVLFLMDGTMTVPIPDQKLSNAG